MINTLIISVFPACGKTHLFNDSTRTFSVVDSDSSKFSWIMRKRTAEELLDLKKEFMKTPQSHFIDSDDYVDSKRDEIIKVRNPEFPKNYIEYIKSLIGKVDYIFVSSHKEVRNALTKEGIEYILIFPDKSLREEWIGRCFLRGNDENFCNLIADNWYSWLDEMFSDAVNNHRSYYILESNEFLSNYIYNQERNK